MTTTVRTEWPYLILGALLAVAAVALTVVFFPLATLVAVAGLVVGLFGARKADTKSFHYGVAAVCGVVLVLSATMWVALTGTGMAGDPAIPPSVAEQASQ